MFTVVKELRSYNQIENRYLIHSVTMNRHYIAVTSKKLNRYDTIGSFACEAQGSKKYLLNKYK